MGEPIELDRPLDDLRELREEDTMGHSIDAAMLATLTVGTLRNRRRALASPAALADAASDALYRQARPDQFVTGVLDADPPRRRHHRSGERRPPRPVLGP